MGRGRKKNGEGGGLMTREGSWDAWRNRRRGNKEKRIQRQRQSVSQSVSQATDQPSPERREAVKMGGALVLALPSNKQK